MLIVIALYLYIYILRYNHITKCYVDKEYTTQKRLRLIDMYYNSNQFYRHHKVYMLFRRIITRNICQDFKIPQSLLLSTVRDLEI